MKYDNITYQYGGGGHILYYWDKNGCLVKAKYYNSYIKEYTIEV